MKFSGCTACTSWQECPEVPCCASSTPPPCPAPFFIIKMTSTARPIRADCEPCVTQICKECYPPPCAPPRCDEPGFEPEFVKSNTGSDGCPGCPSYKCVGLRTLPQPTTSSGTGTNDNGSSQKQILNCILMTMTMIIAISK